jgi:adenosylcobinamide-GDP ribazoletransferase
VGLILALWIAVCRFLDLSPALFAAVAASIPILATGGVHMDGFCDTVDALSSWSSREHMLEILDDPHSGAFAVIWCCVYFILLFGALQELHFRGDSVLVCLVFPISRALAGFSMLSLPKARPGGMLDSFAGKADARAGYILLAAIFAASLAGIFATSAYAGMVCLAVCAFAFAAFRRMVLMRFGGVTGDMVGFLVQVSELALAFGLLAGGVVGDAVS